uniref:SbsA Ig-like domain-containing protein n=2 Tax=Ditylum brightwellii TaxID=49249 RepID=A0A7S4QWB6_9STRA
MKILPTALIVVASLAFFSEAKKIREGTAGKHRQLQDTCVSDFSTTIATCDKAHLLAVLSAHGPTCESVDVELAKFVGGDVATLDADVDAFCAEADAGHSSKFLPFSGISREGDAHDREFLNGGTFWNEQIEMADGLYKLQSDLYRVLEVDQMSTTGIAWPTSANLFSVYECTKNAAMCCYVSDRQSSDLGGTCAGPGCFFAEPEDNTDICYVDMARDPYASRVKDGAAVYDKVTPDDEGIAEGKAHCHGFAWADGDINEKYKGNLLFQVAMKQNLYDKGYVQNVPGAPMCGCIEKMPVVSKAACTDVSVTEQWTASLTAGALSLNIDITDITYNDCGGQDLAQHYSVLLGGGSLASYVVGEGGCEQSTTEFLTEKYGITRSTLTIAETYGHPTQAAVSIIFNSEVAESALDIAKYTIADSGGAALGVTGVSYGSSKNIVVLETDPQTFGVAYTISVTGSIVKLVAPMIGLAENTSADFVVTTYGYEKNVPASAEYLLYADLDLPLSPNYNYPNIPDYSYGTVPFDEFDRVAYFMELESETFGHQWVWVDLDPLSDKINKHGLPVDVLNFHHEGAKGPANIVSNQPNIAPEGSVTEDINVEMWYKDYGTSNTLAIPGASSSKFDFGDVRSSGGNYGSFQIHSITSKSTLFAFNRWGATRSGVTDIGIGNSPEGHPDWTFEQNAEQYSLKKLSILARASQSVQAGVSNLASALPDAEGYHLLYSIDNIANRPNYRSNVPYDYDHSIFTETGSFERVAYYLELTSSTGTEWIWVSMPTFTPDAKMLGVPIMSSKAVFQETINDMNVYSNREGLEGTGLEGGIEFWPNSYTQADASGMPGAVDNLYDMGDTMTTGHYGSMQLHAHTLGHGVQLLSFNRWARSSTDRCDIGIGSNTKTGSHPDWTTMQNCEQYTVKKLQIFIK